MKTIRFGRSATLATLAAATLAFPASAAIARDASGWSINLTPVLLMPDDTTDLGGGVDPEVKYTLDSGGPRLSAGARLGGYYAKNQFGVTLMPTMRLSVPVGPWEPYAAVGMGYGWLPERDHDDFATMSRLGVVFHFTQRFAIGLEGTVQKIDHSNFRFPSLGSALSFNL